MLALIAIARGGRTSCEAAQLGMVRQVGSVSSQVEDAEVLALVDVGCDAYGMHGTSEHGNG